MQQSNIWWTKVPLFVSDWERESDNMAFSCCLSWVNFPMTYPPNRNDNTSPTTLMYAKALRTVVIIAPFTKDSRCQLNCREAIDYWKHLKDPCHYVSGLWLGDTVGSDDVVGLEVMGLRVGYLDGLEVSGLWLGDTVGSDESDLKWRGSDLKTRMG